MKSPSQAFNTLRSDLSASVVVFLVALPLCLGIALASGAPLISGIIAGVVGGIVVGSLSGSSLGVSGPAAGLAVVVLTAVQELGAFDVFLVAVILAGVFQIALGFARAGIIAYYFPSSVINGMLAGIGIIILLKQIPHAFGYDKDPEGQIAFLQPDGANTLSELYFAIQFVSMGPIIIALLSLAILLLWETQGLKKIRYLTSLPAPLVVVAVGVALNLVFQSNSDIALVSDQLVNIPILNGKGSYTDLLIFPDFSALTNINVYKTAVVIAIVASLETLLSVEATDKLDPRKRVTPTNRELKAQGVGNVISGFLGGLPVTQVIVRSSANIMAGGKSKASAIMHAMLLATSVMVLPHVLNLIPLATLAAILIVVGYKLAKPSLFKRIYVQGFGQFIPFIATVFGVVFTDLLVGVGIGMFVAVIGILFENYRLPFQISNLTRECGELVRITLAQQVTFLNKATVRKTLAAIPNNSVVEIDASESVFIHPDVVEIMNDFMAGSSENKIKVSINGLVSRKRANAPSSMNVIVMPSNAEASRSDIVSIARKKTLIANRDETLPSVKHPEPQTFEPDAMRNSRGLSDAHQHSP